MTIKVLVRCTLLVEVEFDDDHTDEQLRFRIEENSCPGTGNVGAVIDALIAEGEAESVCWACNAHGKNEVVSITRGT